MKVNITGALRGAMLAIDPEKDQGAYAYLLEEIIGHIEDVRAGRHTLEEFADFYCMTSAHAKATPHQHGAGNGEKHGG